MPTDELEDILEGMLNQFDYHDHESHREVIAQAKTLIRRQSARQVVSVLEGLKKPECYRDPEGEDAHYIVYTADIDAAIAKAKEEM